MVATRDGWKAVSQHAGHYTGKLADVLKMRLQQRATHRDRDEIDKFRRTILRTCNAQSHGDAPLPTPQTVATFIASRQSIVTDRNDLSSKLIHIVVFR